MLCLVAMLVYCLLITGCSGEKAVLPPDDIPPNYVTDLRVVDQTDSSATLAWTAPGDDGEGARAAVYDLRYSTHVFEEADWSSLDPAGPLAPPNQPGVAETTRVDGLVPSTFYLFGLRVADEQGNWSELSNLAAAKTFREAPPRFILTWGRFGSDPGEFDDPSDIAVSGGRVYVADSNNQRIEIFDRLGNYITQWRGVSPDPGAFSEYLHLAAAPDGTIFVSDAWASKIEAFEPGGNLLRSWSLASSEAIAVNPAGDIAIARYSYLSIVRYRATGEPLPPVLIPTYLCPYVGCYYPQAVNLTFDFQGRMFVLCEREPQGPEIRVFQDTVLVDVWGTAGDRVGSLEDSKGIVADGEGNLFVADTGNNRVQKFTPAGELLTAWGSSGTAPGKFQAPIALDVDGTDLYVVDRDNQRVQLFRGQSHGGPS